MHSVIFIWGFTGVLGKLLGNVEAPVIVIYRTLIGFATMGIFMLITRKRLTLKGKSFFHTCGVGVLIAAHWVTFFQSIHYSNVSFALIFFSTTALFTSFLEPWLMKKKFDPSELIMGLIVVGGIVIIGYDSMQQETVNANPNQNYGLAMICAISSAFLAALFSVLNANLVAKHDAIEITFIELLAGCVITSLAYVGTGLLDFSSFTITGLEFVYLFILGSICTAFAFFMGIYLMKFITPFTMNLSVNMEPIYAMIIAIMIFRDSEVMSPMFYLGASIIIGAVVLNAYIKGARKKKTNALLS